MKPVATLHWTSTAKEALLWSSKGFQHPTIICPPTAGSCQYGGPDWPAFRTWSNDHGKAEHHQQQSPAPQAPRRIGIRHADTPVTTAKSPTKAGTVIAMLRTETGATIAEIMTETDWQAHSVRGFLSGTVKKKLALPLEKNADGADVQRYRIAASTAQPRRLKDDAAEAGRTPIAPTQK